MARETANCSVTPPCITSKSVSPLGFWILKLVHYPSRSESNACHLVADYFFSSEILIHLGMDDPTKTDEFLEKFQTGGGGSFPIQKFMLQILDLK